MALIPGILPSNTCYGTPQDLLELFAQYLDVPAYALSSKVVFSTTSSGLTADVIWFDTTSVTNPILKITVSGGFVDYLKNYITQATAVTVANADYVLISDTSDSGNTKKGLVSDIAALAVPASGSITYPMLSTSGTEANNVAKRTAKAWVFVDGSSGNFVIPAGSSFNVTSVTDNGTGDMTINFTVAMGNATSSVVVSGNLGGLLENGAPAVFISMLYPSSTNTNAVNTTYCRAAFGRPYDWTESGPTYSKFTYYDPSIATFVVFGT